MAKQTEKEKGVKAIDKETMFKKIMPSAVRDIAAPAAPTAPVTPPAPPPEPQQGYRIGVTDGIAAATAASPAADALPAAPLEPQEEPAPAEEPVSINLMERLVFERIPDTIARLGCCNCDQCQHDIAALALNRMSPYYMMSDQLTEEVLCSREMVSRAVTALYQAAFFVKAHPRH